MDPTDWLLDSDPAVRWQVMRDLLGLSESDWRPDRAKVGTECWGAHLRCPEPDLTQ